MYAKSIKIHQTIFVFCVLFALVSPPYNTGMAQEKENKTNSGSMKTRMAETVQNTGTINTKKQCDLDCKVNTLTGIGIDLKLAKPLVESCKRIALDPVHCIIAGASILTAESGGKLKNCYHKNCMGLGGGSIWYETYEAGIIDWANRYQKWWYKARSASFFYPAKGEKSKSRYCTSEESSGSSVGCPMGLSHASSTWNKLSKLF